MQIDLKTTLILLSVLLGSNVATNAATVLGFSQPKVEQAQEKMSFAQDQLDKCLVRLEECHAKCSSE